MKRSEMSVSTETFLRKQNQELRQQLADLQELLKHNKNALRASIDFGRESEPKTNNKLVDMLYRENEYLRGLTFQRQGEVDEAHSKVMISQKMVEASEDYERSLVEELKEVIAGLRNDVRKRELKISQLEKQRPQFDSENMLHVRLVSLTDPQAIAVRMHDQLETIREMLKFKNQELIKEKENRQQLYKLNLALTRQMAEFRNCGMENSTKSKQPPSRSSDLGYFLDCQQKIYDDSASDPSCSSSRSSSPAVEEISKPENKKGGKSIPKLELRRAKEIQQIIVKKINLEDKKKNKGEETGVKKQEIVVLRKNLNKELLKNLQLNRTVDKLMRTVKELESRNLLLLKKTTTGDLPKQSQESFEPTFIRDALALGRDVYLNEQIELIIDGRCKPGARTIRSKSLCK